MSCNTSSPLLKEQNTQHSVLNKKSLSTNAMGTHDIELAASLLNQTSRSLGPDAAHDRNRAEVSLKLFEELQPNDLIESMLMSQLVACHTHCLGMFTNATKSFCEDSQLKYLKLSERLMRTFTASIEALDKHRRGGQQSVVVEHVHVNAGGQAIVGAINQGTEKNGK